MMLCAHLCELHDASNTAVYIGSAMDLVRPTPDEAEAGLRALKAILADRGALSPIAEQLLGASQKHILGTAFDLGRLSPITPDQLAEHVQRPPVRRQLATAMVVLSFASGAAGPTQIDRIEAYSSALGVAVRELDDLRLLVARRIATLRFDILQHMYIGDRIAALYKDQGFVGILEALGGIRGLIERPSVAAKYRGLGALPVGTLGRGYFDYAIANGFPFPGERGGAPEMIIPHDAADWDFWSVVEEPVEALRITYGIPPESDAPGVA